MEGSSQRQIGSNCSSTSMVGLKKYYDKTYCQVSTQNIHYHLPYTPQFLFVMDTYSHYRMVGSSRLTKPRLPLQVGGASGITTSVATTLLRLKRHLQNYFNRGKDQVLIRTLTPRGTTSWWHRRVHNPCSHYT